ncbi:DedA family protein [Cryobacterium sinapicolor]|uniref:DedA family protein n=1 Tax=Cryobacterium sinapicolor TaxID=1259236 RepID=A0ABY2IWU9_9MICO|nr:DedA family protein [Cryobacterium sinapicolor]TFC96394.1 DedA family protein [Cryobacterium sinapicolor]
MDFINELIIAAVASPWLYLVMFAVALVDGFFPPIPSEMVLVAAAAAAASSGGPNLLVLGAVAAAGAMIGDNIAYAIGRSVGNARFRWMRRPRVAASLDWAQRRLQSNGTGLILVGRFIPVGRVAVNMSAGAVGYPWRRFLPLSAVAGATWAAYSAGLGLVAGQWLTDQPLLSALLGTSLALVISVVIDQLMGIRRRQVLARAKNDSGKDALANAPQYSMTK